MQPGMPYMPPPPPPRRSNAWIWILGGCGGCALLVIVGIALSAFFLKETVKGTVVSIEKSQRLVALLSEKKYEEATTYFAPSARQKWSAAQLKKTVEETQKQVGAFKSWGDVDMKSNSNNGELELIHTYRIRGEKGTAEMRILYFSANPLKPSTEATDFALEVIEQGVPNDSEPAPENKKSEGDGT